MEQMLMQMMKQLFSIDDYPDTRYSFEIRKQLLEFLRQEKQLFMAPDDENILLAKDGIRFIDANNAMIRSSDRLETRALMLPFFERLMKKDFKTWHFYEFKLLMDSLMFTESAGDAVQLALAAGFYLSSQKADYDQPLGVLRGMIAINVLSRLLYAKFFEYDHDVKLDEEFDIWFSKLEQLAYENKELDSYLHTVEIRRGLFNVDIEMMSEHYLTFKKKYNDQTVHKMDNEMQLYMTSSKFQYEMRKKNNSKMLRVNS